MSGGRRMRCNRGKGSVRCVPKGVNRDATETQKGDLLQTASEPFCLSINNI